MTPLLQSRYRSRQLSVVSSSFSVLDSLWERNAVGWSLSSEGDLWDRTTLTPCLRRPPPWCGCGTDADTTEGFGVASLQFSSNGNVLVMDWCRCQFTVGSTYIQPRTGMLLSWLVPRHCTSTWARVRLRFPGNVSPSLSQQRRGRV